MSLMESLDSLWFYGNVLASRRSTHMPLLGATEIQAKDEWSTDKVSSPRCLKDGEVRISTEPAVIAKAVEEEDTIKSKEEEKKKKKRSRRMRMMRGKVFGEGDELGFESKVYNGSLACGFGGENDKLVRMPPLNDGMAMKKHLKSWAHAVACAVR